MSSDAQIVKRKEEKMKKRSEGFFTVMLLIASAMWGFGYIAVQSAIDNGYSTLFTMFARFGIAVVLLAIIFNKQLKGITRTEVVGGIITGTLMQLAFLLQTYGLEYTTPSNNAFITVIFVVLVPIFSWMIYKVKPSNLVFLSAILCVVGVLFLTVDLSVGMSKFGFGDFLTFLCAIFFALEMIAIGHYAQKTNIIRLNFIVMVVCAVISGVMFFIFDGDLSQFTPTIDLWSIMYLAFFSTTACYVLQTWAQKYVGTNKTVVVLSTESLFASLFSVMVGYEKFSITMIVGGLFIFVAVLITEFSSKKEEKSNDDTKEEMVEGNIKIQEQDVKSNS